MNLPEGVTTPKFELFERVQYGTETATVTGMRWIPAVESICYEYSRFGWYYSLSRIYGKPIDEVINERLGDRSEIFLEHESVLMAAIQLAA